MFAEFMPSVEDADALFERLNIRAQLTFRSRGGLRDAQFSVNLPSGDIYVTKHDTTPTSLQIEISSNNEDISSLLKFFDGVIVLGEPTHFRGDDPRVRWGETLFDYYMSERVTTAELIVELTKESSAFPVEQWRKMFDRLGFKAKAGIRTYLAYRNEAKAALDGIDQDEPLLPVDFETTPQVPSFFKDTGGISTFIPMKFEFNMPKPTRSSLKKRALRKKKPYMCIVRPARLRRSRCGWSRKPKHLKPEPKVILRYGSKHAVLYTPHSNVYWNKFGDRLWRRSINNRDKKLGIRPIKCHIKPFKAK